MSDLYVDRINKKIELIKSWGLYDELIDSYESGVISEEMINKFISDRATVHNFDVRLLGDNIMSSYDKLTDDSDRDYM